MTKNKTLTKKKKLVSRSAPKPVGGFKAASKAASKAAPAKKTGSKASDADHNAKVRLDAINANQAVIEFNLDGTVITANQNFLDATGYTLEEIQGRHHGIFVGAAYRLSPEYKIFWERLGRGEADQGQYRRFRKNGQEVWLQASYNPLRNSSGVPYRVIKYAADITEAKQKQADSDNQLRSIGLYQAVIEFKLDGTIVSANQNFLDAVGYTLSEIQGKHHSIFVEPNQRQTPEYRAFWERLGRGEADHGQYKRLRKDGSEVWLQASYNPIFDLDGKPVKVIKYASDITQAKQSQADADSKLRSISLYQAVIEFKLDGTIVTANKNFLDAVGYTLAEIQGKHHSMFVEPSYRQSQEYRYFWEKLGRGEADHGQYKRRRKDGSEVWLQASYNPIFDLDGSPIKVIKYASDITASKQKQADADGQLRSIGTFQAIIEFKLDGTIVTANQNFLDAVGYTLSDIKGKHHSMFVEPSYRQTPEYRYFWENLSRGEADHGQYKRLRKDGSEIWLQASYNPIFDLDGNPIKVIKYATDITEHKKMEQTMHAAMSETSRVMKALATGNLQDTMRGDFQGEFAELRDSVNSSVEHLRETVSRIRHAGSTLSVSASEIAIGNQDLSTRTEEQAATLASTATSMEELTGTVKQNAGSAREANQLAAGARNEAERGGAVVEAAITAMKAINESSNRIADIIGVIDEIAFQTNLLALNAAVEAARAGEQGRGFAVVAAEVRNLAQRSAGAAKEIKTLIKDSVGKVDEGSRLVKESGAMLQQIVLAAKKVSDIISEIASASAEQAAGIDTIGEAIQKMDAVVQQNSALVEEAAAASAMMDEQTKDMDGLMQFFKLSENDQLFTPAHKDAPAVKRMSKPVKSKLALASKAPIFSLTDSEEEF